MYLCKVARRRMVVESRSYAIWQWGGEAGWVKWEGGQVRCGRVNTAWAFTEAFGRIKMGLLVLESAETHVSTMLQNDKPTSSLIFNTTNPTGSEKESTMDSTSLPTTPPT